MKFNLKSLITLIIVIVLSVAFSFVVFKSLDEDIAKSIVVAFLTIGALGAAYKWAEYKGYINLGETHKIESSHKLYEHNITKEIDSNNRHK